MSRRSADAEHLKLLSTFYFVSLGLTVLGLFMLYGHYALVSNVLSNPKLRPPSGAPAVPVDMFGVLKWVYLVLGAWLVGSGVLNLLSALFIRARKHRMFSLVVAAINCFYMPIGTALGVFTIVVLVRDSVRALYQAAE